MVGAELAVRARDAKKMRAERPFLFTNLKTGEGLNRVIAWNRSELLFVSGLDERPADMP